MIHNAIPHTSTYGDRTTMTQFRTIPHPDWTLEEEEALTKLAAVFDAAGKPEGAQIGRKFDGGKLDYTLVPFEGLDEIVKVLMFGAKKYDRDNWRHVDNAMQRYAAASFRHLTAYNKGERTDPETGLSHLAHVGCCILFMLALENQNGGNPGIKS